MNREKFESENENKKVKLICLLLAGFADLKTHPEVEKDVEDEDEDYITVLFGYLHGHRRHCCCSSSDLLFCLLSILCG